MHSHCVYAYRVAFVCLFVFSYMFMFTHTCCCLHHVDPPRKRLDSSVSNSQVVLERVRSHSVGSPFSNSVSELPQVSTSPRLGYVLYVALCCTAGVFFRLHIKDAWYL